MPARRKTLPELVRDRSFRARRHADRLLGPPLRRGDLRALQQSYAATSDGRVREAIAVAFERAACAPTPGVSLPRPVPPLDPDWYLDYVAVETGKRPKTYEEADRIMSDHIGQLLKRLSP